jgi:hypothetical protein
VKITKKAKPTLSSVHMRELLDAKLVEELAHPTDKRKKIYRLKGRRIGSSSLPVEQLRNAVKSYVGVASAARLPLTAALEAIAAAPASAPDATLRAQARKLGELVSEGFAPASLRDGVTALAALFEREGIARPLKLDLEGHSLEMELEKQLEGEETRLALLVAALAEGLLGSRPEARVRLAATSGRRFTVGLSGP